MRVTNGIPLGCQLLLPVGTVNSVETLKVLVLDRPASSPWMWESWAVEGSKGAEFGPATRGPFPLYVVVEMPWILVPWIMMSWILVS